MQGRICLLAALMILTTACGSDLADQAAAETAMAFLRAQPDQACVLLAPDTAEELTRTGSSCADGLAAAAVPPASMVREVEVAGEAAQVRLDDQVVFLARFGEVWKVTAAGCVRDDPDPAAPYECAVEP